MFVIQKHSARRLHYDLRLEVDGVLKSWAVPKGPSLDPSQKRLAAMVEDHPLDYASFEGSIPKGEYGGGEVIVWDNGTYSPDEGGRLLFGQREEAQAEMREGIRAGKISFSLRGQKLKGSWTLVKVKAREKDWLLIKHKDQSSRSDDDVLSDGGSVLSGRTTEDIKAGIRAAEPVGRTSDLGKEEGARRLGFPGFVPPMLASLADTPFSHSAWVFEPKLDGYRVIATIDNGEANLWSRRGVNVTASYKPLSDALKTQPVSQAILDGEMVALNEQGNVSFETLQQYLQKGRNLASTPLIYYVFDVLYLDGYDLTGVRLEARKRILRSILAEAGGVRVVDSFDSDGKAVFEAALKNKLEGVIGKKKDSVYQAGRRSGDWLKVKSTKSGDFIIGGYTLGEGSRVGSLGALLIGFFDEKSDLVYAGHVGSGFNESTLTEVRRRLDALRIDSCPFRNVPPANAPATWVRPELVAEVKYSEWTRDGRLRSPVFLRLRDDKPSIEVYRTETVAAPHSTPRPDRQEVMKDLLEQINVRKESFVITVEGNRIKLGNVDKELWPANANHLAITKRQFLAYLATMSPYLLPHLENRPITLSRYPDGIYGEHFWQKHWNYQIPEFLSTVNIAEESGAKKEYLMCNNLSTLIWLGQAADVEFHTWYSRVVPDHEASGPAADVDQILNYPDFIVFDVDPYIYSGKEKPGDEPEFNRSAFDKACEVAMWLKELLDTLSLNAFIKTSGKTGLHVYVPIVRNLEYRSVRSAAETIGRYLMQRHGNDITMEWAVEKRTGKVFIDYAQNVRGKTLASVYSPRPNSEAGVSFPLRWEELGKAYPTDFTVLNVPDLMKGRGDIWAGILDAKKDVTKALGIR